MSAPSSREDCLGRGYQADLLGTTSFPVHGSSLTPQELSVESPPNHFPLAGPTASGPIRRPRAPPVGRADPGLNKKNSPRAGGEGKSGPNKGPNKKDSPLAPQPVLWAHSTPIRRTSHGSPAIEPSFLESALTELNRRRRLRRPSETHAPPTFTAGVLARSLPAPLARSRRRDRGSSCMTASTDWPRIGPAAYRAATREDGLRREANPQLDGHLRASLQVANSAPRTLSRWRHG